MKRKSSIAITKGKRSVQEIAISEFKAKCLSLLEEVDRTKRPLRVTRRGKPIADVIPALPDADDRSWIGSMAGTMEIAGDIVSPVIDIGEIEALRDLNSYSTPTFGYGVWCDPSNFRDACSAS
jgi:prevent-host-death family protein